MLPKKTLSMAPKCYIQPKPEGDLEDMPSLTTLRAELSDVQARSFKSTASDWDPRKSKKEALKQNTDQRTKFLPSRLEEEDVPEMESAVSSCSDLEDTPSLTALRAELSDVHVQSFKSTSGDWDPRKSRKDRLKQNTDQRAKFLPSRLEEEDVPDLERASFSCPDLDRDPSLTSLRAELSGVQAAPFQPTKGEWDPRKSKKERLKNNTDERAKRLPSRLPELERDPSLTSLRAELSDVHAKPFQVATGDWDPRRSKLERLKNNTDQRPSRIPSQLPPGQGPKKVLSLLQD